MEMRSDTSTLLDKGRRCLSIEIEAIEATREALDDSFAVFVRKIEETVAAGRKLIFVGMGKSANICQKLAGTFNSIAAPACFLDPIQALHGDLGLCGEKDFAILISNSGETQDLVRLIPMIKRLGLDTGVLTSHPGSALTRVCDLTLVFQVPEEACPLRLAPTASTTASLALGDALAMVLLELRGFTREDFARFHPAGTLGMSLLLKVSDIMRTGDRFAVCADTVTVQEAILSMTRAKAGCIALHPVNESAVSGVFTDGDFRRCALSRPDFLQQPVNRFMTRNPKTLSVDALAVDALKLFEEHNIEDLIVVDAENRPVGIIDNQDLPKLRMV